MGQFIRIFLLISGRKKEWGSAWLFLLLFIVLMGFVVWRMARKICADGSPATPGAEAVAQ
jgi:hypothetical protein